MNVLHELSNSLTDAQSVSALSHVRVSLAPYRRIRNYSLLLFPSSYTVQVNKQKSYTSEVTQTLPVPPSIQLECRESGEPVRGGSCLVRLGTMK